MNEIKIKVFLKLFPTPVLYSKTVHVHEWPSGSDYIFFLGNQKYTIVWYTNKKFSTSYKTLHDSKKWLKLTYLKFLKGGNLWRVGALQPYVRPNVSISSSIQTGDCAAIFVQTLFQAKYSPALYDNLLSNKRLHRYELSSILQKGFIPHG